MCGLLVRLFPCYSGRKRLANAPIPRRGSPTARAEGRAFASLKEVARAESPTGSAVSGRRPAVGRRGRAALLADLVGAGCACALIVLTLSTDDEREPVRAGHARAAPMPASVQCSLCKMTTHARWQMPCCPPPTPSARRVARSGRQSCFVRAVEQGHSAPASFEEMCSRAPARLEPEPRRLREVTRRGRPIDADAVSPAAAENAFGALAILRTGRLARGVWGHLEAYHDGSRTVVST